MSRWSISKKLMWFATAIVAGVLVFVLIVSSINDAVSAKEAATKQLVVLADVIARNSASSILFNDVGDAQEMLSALQANQSIQYASIVDRNGHVFATYQGTKNPNFAWLDIYNDYNRVFIERPILQNGRSEGTLKLHADLDYVWVDLFKKWMTNLLALGIAVALGYMVLRRVIQHILQPINKLTLAAHEIIAHRVYSLRVEKTSDDELGALTDDFNAMLAQIELRDKQLQQNSEALAQSQDAISLRDEQYRIQYVNPAFTALFGYHLEEIHGSPFFLQPVDDDEDELSPEEVYTIAREQGGFRGEITKKSKSGELIPISLQVSPIRDKNGKVTGYVSLSSDISERINAQEIIWRQANFDSVTDLPNRHMFNDQLQQEILRTQRTGRPFALLLLDLDNFKEINDNLGHDAGDKLLKEIAERLVKCLRITDTVGYFHGLARLGGDEFTIIINNFNEMHNVDEVVQRILNQLNLPIRLGMETVNVTASIGVTIYPDDASDAETLIKNADLTMYHAKEKGGNTFSYFTRAMQQAAQRRREMTHDLKIALEEQQFSVVYQPILDLVDGQAHKVEALIRWNHPKHGFISPMEFIPIAEETGLIVEIGNWVFYQAVAQLIKWRQTIDPNFQISINKSPAQFHNKGNSHAPWFEHLNNNGLPGDSIVIEITEGLMLNKDTMVSDKLLAFRDAGVQVAVDDFGTGYSSLSYLKKFDIDYIKIDKSFVQNLSENSEDMVLCEAIIVMAHKLGLKVVAEGIETKEQRDLLMDVGCDFGQGYFFSRPIPADQIEAFYLGQSGAKESPSLSAGTLH